MGFNSAFKGLTASDFCGLEFRMWTRVSELGELVVHLRFTNCSLLSVAEYHCYR